MKPMAAVLLVITLTSQALIETLHYLPDVGTITNYRSTSKTTARLVSSDVLRPDGSVAPAGTSAAIIQGILAGMNLQTLEESRDTVREVTADGSRIVQTQGEVKIINQSGLNLPTQRFTYTLVYSTNGQVTLQDLRFDTTNLSRNLAMIVERHAQAMRDSLSAQFVGAFSVGFVVGQSRAFRRLERVALISDLSPVELESSIERTFTDRGVRGNYVFDLKTQLPEFAVQQPLPISTTPVRYHFEPTTSLSKQSFMADGRLEGSSSRVTTRFRMEFTLNTNTIRMVVDLEMVRKQEMP
jgi:hypothetical protein